LVLEASIDGSDEFDLTHPANPADVVLTLTNALEELQQFDIDALVSEDLALLESHYQGGLHGFFYKPTQDPDVLRQVLEIQQYRSDLMELQALKAAPLMQYWLCRRLTVLLPWSAVLERFKPEQKIAFPHLYRLGQIAQYLEADVISEDLSDNAVYDIAILIPQLSTDIEQVFSTYSQQAGIPRPVCELVLAEGNTEALMIPAIAEAMGHNLDREGIMVLPVGGKNQMLQQYVNYAEHLSIPIYIVMDRDAQSLLPDLTYYQRDQDQIFVLEEGEFEDIYAPDLIVKTINTCYQPSHPVTKMMLKDPKHEGRVKIMQRLWQQLGLGLFDKIDFAQYMAQMIRAEKRVSPEMESLIQKILYAKQSAQQPSPLSL
jgi:hypothetical protein